MSARARSEWHEVPPRRTPLLPMAQERRGDWRWSLLALLPLAYFLGQLVRGAIVHGGSPW